MSTYLQLCSDLRREVNASGTGPTAVTNQTGEYLRIVNWVKNAWTEIQGRSFNWRWMRSTFSVNTTSGDEKYAGTDCTDGLTAAAVTRFSRWIPFDDDGASNVKCYLTSGGVAGEYFLTNLPWNYYTSLYRLGTQNNGQPIHVSIDPQNNLVLGPKPDGIYTISGEYQRSAQELAADADTPEMPSPFHQLVVYIAMQKYAGYQNAPEVMSRGVTEGNRLMRQLEMNQLPMVGLGAPLA